MASIARTATVNKHTRQILDITEYINQVINSPFNSEQSDAVRF